MKMRYLYGGAGGYRVPENASWGGRLGRHWSHEFAERIVASPDETTVWLITKSGSFRKFTDLNGSDVYETALPPDEYRTLEWLGASTGWVLRGLDGTQTFFRPDGLWSRTEDRQNPSQPTLPAVAAATYDSTPQLTSVTFRDGTRIDFLYHASGANLGMLQTLRRVGVGGSPTSDWTYTWSNTAGRDLTRIDRPDGSRWEFLYDNSFPRHMSRATLVGVGGSSRIEGAWAYDAQGRLSQAWKGSASFASGVEKFSWNYQSATETVVTDSYGNETVYEFDREESSFKPRLLSIQGECGTCGSSPNSSWEYADTLNPMRATKSIDGEGVETEFLYDEDTGLLVYRLEAAGATGSASFPRETAWEYHPLFKAFLTEIVGPVKESETATRTITRTYDAATGNLETEAIDGVEATYPPSGSFSLTTQYLDYNSAGGVGDVDPPGFGTADQTSFTYDVPGRFGTLPDTRTDPLVGTTEFDYDEFNRRTHTTDPNGAVTLTAYDPLDRITSVTEYGDPDTATDDRVTRYFYNAIGDLFCVKTPAGAGTQYEYNDGGRLRELIRGTARANPTSTACLETNQLRERAIYGLDSADQRISEKLQRTTTATWPNTTTTFDRWTKYSYSSLCHLDSVEEVRAVDNMGNITDSAITDYEYDCRGNLWKAWDANHPRASYPSQPSTTYVYDEVNRLVSMTIPWGGAGGGSVTTSYEYDVHDHLVQVTDGEGTVTSYVYSDRDRMTSQGSEVSGATTYEYNEHGELVEETDARSVTVSRTVDAAGRVELVDYPGSDLDVDYTWGTDAEECEIGRLIAIERNAEVIDHAYDCHGRMLQDGDLSYSYNADGDRETVSYPGSLVATYTYDRMNRPTRLTITENGGMPQVVVLSSNPAVAYKPFGPLTSLGLDLATDRHEVRTYDLRYAPTSIRLQATSGNPPALFGWDYTTDDLGNVMTISQTAPSSVSRSYDYQEWQQYLVEANGPWGARYLDYDRAGNRVAENSQPYTYEPNNAASGNTSELTSVSLGFIGSNSYSFDGGGYLEQFATPLVGPNQAVIDFTFDAAGALSYIDHNRSKDSLLRYDGRGFLAGVYDATGADLYLTPTYSSAGVLHSLLRTMPSWPAERTNVLYFHGRPIGIWKKVGTSAATLTRIVTDHLGTPAASIQQAGTAVDWYGGFDPFGEDWQANTLQDSMAKGIFLRMPGQWKDPTWSTASDPMELLYNVHRWYETGTGRYTRLDPAVGSIGVDQFTYVRNQPTRLTDQLGLFPDMGCCTAAVRLNLFSDGAGGIVVCCSGKKFACLSPDFSDPISSPIAKRIISDCATQHETRHFSDVDCPPCGIERPEFRVGTTRRNGECPAWGVELHCLGTSKSQCGSDAQCVQEVGHRQSQAKEQQNVLQCGP